MRRISSGDSVPLSTLLDEQLSYVQSDHQTIEPRRDSFQFHLTDSLVISARKELVFRIEVNHCTKLTRFTFLLNLSCVRISMTNLLG